MVFYKTDYNALGLLQSTMTRRW